MTKLSLDQLLVVEEDKRGSFNIPVLKIKGIYDSMTAGYLAPFRYYGFQISSTRDGRWDLGSCAPMRWDDTIEQQDLIKQLIETLNSYFDNWYGNPGFSVAIADNDTIYKKGQKYENGEFRNYTINDFDCIIQLSEIQKTELWKRLIKFVDESYIYEVLFHNTREVG